jgi:hypothetical protein
MAYLTAHEDPELLPWLLGIANEKPTPAGDFLDSLAEAALRADSANYCILRPALQQIREKYPKYEDPGAETV